jgi:hypothetical protein
MMMKSFYLEITVAQSVNVQYAITQFPTPVFNTPNIASCFGGDDGDTLPLDDQGLMKTVETVLFPQSKVELLEQVAQSSIWRIRTHEYNYGGDYYIDDRFVQLSSNVPARRTISVPSMPTILSKLNQLVGTPYIWGGNWPDGIDLVIQFYPSRTPLHQLTPLVQNTWKFKGLDCTGLFHYVSDGYTERNSSSLVNFGKPVFIEGLSLNEIMSKVSELDLIVWDGHVVGVFDEKTAIESKVSEGVVKVKLSDRLAQIMKDRKPVNQWSETKGPRFVIRRWHPKTQVKNIDFIF